MSDTEQPQSTNEATDVETPTPIASSLPPDDISAPLASLITAIRTALRRDASADTRAAGAIACRSLLAVLEAKPGQPFVAAPSTTPMASMTPASPLASLLSQPGLLTKLAAMSRDELIAMLQQITRAMPARSPAPSTAGPRFHLVEIPRPRKPDGDR